jgi:hypothetical protein
LNALAELAPYVDFNAAESLVTSVAHFALDGESPTIRRAALSVLGAMRLEPEASESVASDVLSFVVQNDDDEGCRIAAIEAVVRIKCVDAAYDSLLFALGDVRSVRLAALTALSAATPTVPLVQTLTELLIRHHDDQETVGYALATLCVLIRRGFRLTRSGEMLGPLATVTEFFSPVAAAVVAIAHARAIRCNAGNAEEAISELSREFKKRRFSPGADAYWTELWSPISTRP